MTTSKTTLTYVPNSG